MTSTLAGPAEARVDERESAPRAQRSQREISGLDVLAGGSLLVVSIVAWVSLTLAHLGRHSLADVAAGSAGALLLLAVPLLRRLRLRPDLAGMAVALVCAAVLALLTYPGFSYGVSDKDPGGYVSHAIEISRTGDFSFTDPLLAQAAKDPTFPVQLTSPGARFSGVWVYDDKGTIVPQFYHLWPALLATSYDVAGIDGIRATTPLLGAVAVLLLVALLRRVGDALLSDPVGAALDPGGTGRRRLGRAGGLVAAGAGGLLMATNMLQVWQSRYPSTEVFAQALYLGALLGIVVALQTGWRPAAGLAGLFVGIGWLNRADGLLLVLLSAGIGAALLATRRWDSRATWYTGGLLIVTPHALRQAYEYAHNYSLANDIPPLRTVAVLVAGLFAVAAVLRFAGRRPLTWAQDGLLRRRPQMVAGGLVVVGAAALLVLGFLRPTLFGKAYFDYNNRLQIRSYDEQIMARLAWFFSYPGFALMIVGLAVVALRRWHASVWAVVLPTLVLFPVYGYTANNSTRLLWWSRRYVPTVLPGILILLALAIAFFAVKRYRGRLWTTLPALAALAGLVALFLSQSLPLRQHDEWRGSFAISQRIADLAGNKQGIFLWEFDQGCCANPTRLFATPVWLQHGQLSGLLASDDNMALDGNARSTVIDLTHQAFPGRPVFLVADGKGGLPEGIDPSTVEPVDRIKAELPIWEESDTERPDEVRQLPVEINVWHVLGT